MLPFIKNIAWYPPAETKLPWPAIFSAFTRRTGNFSDKLRSYFDIEHCILGESARVLLFKLLETLKKKDGDQRDEVLIPGYTCYSVAAAVAKAGLKITVYDLDPNTLHADIGSIENAITEKTLAVVAQHLFGILTPIDEIRRLSHKNGAYLIEDAAQAFGKINTSRPPGTMGDFGLFSFGRGKPLPIGGGGALVSHDNLDVLNGMRLNSDKKGYRHAIVSAATQLISKPALYWIPEMLPLRLGETVFDLDFDVKGITNSIESMLIHALPILNRLNAHRMRVSDIYLNQINPAFLISHRIEDAVSMTRFPVMISNRNLKKEWKQFGVRRMYPKCISNENTIKPYLTKNPKPTPGATEISRQLITLPTHMGINANLAKQISAIVQNC